MAFVGVEVLPVPGRQSRVGPEDEQVPGVPMLGPAGDVAAPGHGGPAVDNQQPGLPGDPGARGQPDEVVRVRQLVGLVEVVDPSAEPAVGVPPGADVGDVQVPAREHGRGVPDWPGGPVLGPAVVGAAEEGEGIGRVAQDAVLGVEGGADG